MGITMCVCIWPVVAGCRVQGELEGEAGSRHTRELCASSCRDQDATVSMQLQRGWQGSMGGWYSMW